MDHEKRKLHFENFTIVPNELVEKIIACKLCGSQLKICLYLLRKTFGWQRHYTAVSLTDFADACGSNKQWMSKQVQELAERRIIIRSENAAGGKKPVYKINNHISEWVMDQPGSDKSLSNIAEEKEQPGSCGSMTIESCESMTIESCESMTIPSCGSMTLPSCGSMTLPSCESMTIPSCGSMTHEPDHALEQPGSQESLNKDLNKGNKILNKESQAEEFSEDSIYYTLAKLLLDKIMVHYSELIPPNLQEWAKVIYQIIETDKRNPATVKRVINFAQSDPFWRPNILDAETLRRKFDKLNAKRLSRAGKSRLYDDYEIYIP